MNVLIAVFLVALGVVFLRAGATGAGPNLLSTFFSGTSADNKTPGTFTPGPGKKAI